MFILSIICSSLLITDAVFGPSCWPHNVTEKSKKMCSVRLKIAENKVPEAFFSADCKKREEGCTHAPDESICCCSGSLCNTLSWIVKDRNSQPIGVYAYIAPIVIAFFLVIHLVIVFLFTMQDRLPNSTLHFATSMHVNLTELIVKPSQRIPEQDLLIVNVLKQSKKPVTPASGSSSISGGSQSCMNKLPKVKVKGVITYSTNDRTTIRESAKQPKMEGITENSTFQLMLARVIQLGPREIQWETSVVLTILDNIYHTFIGEPTLLEISAPCAIYGDIHGQYSDVWRWFNLNGWPVNNTRSLFLGDYVDRGRHSTEVMMLLFLLKLHSPSNIFICRGNHEDGNVNKNYSFYSEVKCRFGAQHKKVFAAFEKVFSVMPLACVVGTKILCMHGGLAPEVETLDDILNIARPLLTTTTLGQKHVGLLWSDPQIGCMSYKRNVKRDEAGGGIGYLFGRRQIRQFCKKNDLSLIVRGHQPPMSGYERVGRRLVTIFSTPGYRVEHGVGNMGSSMIVKADGSVYILRIMVGEVIKEKRQKYKMEKGDDYRDCGKPSKKRKNRRRSRNEKYS